MSSYMASAIVNRSARRTGVRHASSRKRISELQQRPADPTKRARRFGGLSVAEAIDQYAEERRSQVSERMAGWWKEMGRPLAGFFGDKPLRKISSADLTAYQNARTDLGRAPKTVNSELSVLRQVLKHAKLWYSFAEDYKALRNTKPPAGQALTDDDQARLFQVARSNPEPDHECRCLTERMHQVWFPRMAVWFFAYVAATLDFFCGLRACEIKGLQWKHVAWEDRRLSIRRSKTPAGWRDPSLNDTCLEALCELHASAQRLGFNDPEHFLFPWHGQHKQLDPTRPMTSWRTAWRSLRKAAGLPHVRFHDGRHTALTRLAEKGVPDWVIRAQFGHVSPAMMGVYSHVRRKALDEAALALEPEGPSAAPQGPPPPKDTVPRRRVTSHVTSRLPSTRGNLLAFPKEFGAPSTTRTCDLLVRSQTLYPTELWARGMIRNSTTRPHAGRAARARGRRPADMETTVP